MDDMLFPWYLAGVRLVKTPGAAGSAFPLASRRSALGENTKRGGKNPVKIAAHFNL